MLTIGPSFSLRVSVRAILACAALAAICGCATVTFKSKREARFINMDAEVVHVSYGEEKRTETLPNGLVCTFEGKVRIKLPDDKRVVLYQTLSTSGTRYASADKRYEFREKGPYCIISLDGRTLFEGVYCRSK